MTARAARDGYTVRVARSEDEVEELRPAWLELQGSLVTTDLDYFLTTVRHKPEVHRPHVVLYARDGRPRLLIVGRLEDVELTFRLGYRTVFEPTVRALAVAYGGFLGDVGESEADMLVDELLATVDRREAEAVHLPNLRVDGPVFRTLRRRTRFPRLMLGAREQPHWRLRVQGSYDELLASRSATSRRRIRQYGKRLVAEYGDRAAVRVFTSPAEMNGLLADAAAVAQTTYQHRLGFAFTDNPIKMQLLALAGERGWLRGYVLYVDDAPQAFRIGYAYRGIFHSDSTGYDPAFASYGPGSFLLARVVADMCNDETIEAIDLGPGDSEHKRRLGGERVMERHAVLFAPSLRGIGVNAAGSTLLGVDRLARRLAGWGGTSRLKRAWRRGVGAERSPT